MDVFLVEIIIYVDGESREHFSVYLNLSTLHNIYYAK